MMDLAERIIQAQALYDGLDHEDDAKWYSDCLKCTAARLLEQLYRANLRRSEDPITALQRERSECDERRKDRDAATSAAATENAPLPS